MQGYRIDFSMNREHEMTIGREQGIYRNELDEIELNMLNSQRVPYLLPVDWFELDGEVTFRYTLTGKKMLLHRLQQQPLTMEQYYMLILGITDALNECKHYMLRPEGCLLDEKFIFIGEQLHDIHLAYVPLKETAEEQSKGMGDLLSLIVRFTSYIDGIDGDGLKRVLHHLSGKKWPLVELRATLLDLIGGNQRQQPIHIEKSVLHKGQQTFEDKNKKVALGNSARENLTYEKRIYEKRTNEYKTHDYNTHEKQTNSPTEQKSYIQSENHPFIGAEKEAFMGKDNRFSHQQTSFNEEVLSAKRSLADLPYVEELDELEQNSKRKWIITAVFTIMIACVWRFFYFADGARHSLLISAGISLLLLAALLFIWRKGTDKSNSTEESLLEMGLSEDNDEPFSKLELDDYKEGYLNEVKQMKEDVKPSRGNNLLDSLPSMPSIPKPSIQSVVMPVAEPTMLLGRSKKNENKESKGEAWLQRCWAGQEARIDLMDYPHFKIGRTGEQVSYEDQANGVSRIHLEIEQNNGERSTKDLGSRNGSLLNGETMIPYKTYRLAIGDVIHLAGEDGPRYELKSG